MPMSYIEPQAATLDQLLSNAVAETQMSTCSNRGNGRYRILSWLAGAAGRSDGATSVTSFQVPERSKAAHKHHQQDQFRDIDFHTKPVVELTHRQRPGYPNEIPIVHQQRGPLTPPPTPSTRSEYSFISNTEETIMPGNEKNHRSHRDSNEKADTVEVRRGGRSERARANDDITPDASTYLDTQAPCMSWVEACRVLDRCGCSVTIDFSIFKPNELATLPDHPLFQASSLPRSTTHRGSPEEALRVLIPLRPKIEYRGTKAPQTIGINLRDTALSTPPCDVCGQPFTSNTEREGHFAEDAIECDECEGSFKCAGRWSQHACVAGTGSPRRHRKQNSASLLSPPGSVLRFSP